MATRSAQVYVAGVSSWALARGATPVSVRAWASRIDHLVDPAQTILFDARRAWSCLTVGALDQLPALTPAAEALIGEFSQQARSRAWNKASRNNGTKTLRILLAWIGVAAPIHEADIRALSDRPGTTIRRVLQFLDERGMVIPDPAREGTAVQRTVQQRIQTLPDGIAGELRQWVQVVRGEGRREHRELPFATIRSYLNCFYPVLAAWAGRITSLREITRDDIREVLDDRAPVTARNLLPALRSLFRALRQERIIFRDPTRGITLPAMRRLPVPIPTGQLRGLIDRADGPMAKLIVTLIAIHGLGKKGTTRLLTDDLDRQPPPAGHQADRPRRQQPPDSPHRHRRHLPGARPQPIKAPPGPDPGRGQAHR